MSVPPVHPHQPSRLHRFLLNMWYRKGVAWRVLAALLLPFSWIFRGLSLLRRKHLSVKQAELPLPVVVVGNISVGGTGKTPVVLALLKALSERGVAVGVISRGYVNDRSSKQAPPVQGPLRVTATTAVADCGDEAYLIAVESACPVVVAADRLAAARYLIQHNPSLELIISDDGLQHYRLPRSLEIAVIDGDRGLGNGHCLPAGPLREPPSRLQSVDWVLFNGQCATAMAVGSVQQATFRLQPQQWLHVVSGRSQPLKPLPWSGEKRIAAIAAIGNPQRFFATLTALGIPFDAHAFDDHYHYQAEDLQPLQHGVILMTQKDAVKCKALATDTCWALEVGVQLPQDLLLAIENLAIENTALSSREHAL